MIWMQVLVDTWRKALATRGFTRSTGIPATTLVAQSYLATESESLLKLAGTSEMKVYFLHFIEEEAGV